MFNEYYKSTRCSVIYLHFPKMMYIPTLSMKSVIIKPNSLSMIADQIEGEGNKHNGVYVGYTSF